MSGLHLGDFFTNRQEPGQTGLPVMSVTMNDGLVSRDDIERRTESTLRADQHLLVRKGDIAYNMMRMWQGACGLAEADGIVSPAYVVLAPKPGIDSRFAYQWFKTQRMIHLFWSYSHGLTEDRLRLYFDEFSEIPASPPPILEQRRITAILETWDRAIAETERLIEAKRRRKTGLLSAMFGPERNPLKTRGVPLEEIGTVHYGKSLPAEAYDDAGGSLVFGTQGIVGRTNLRLFDGPAIIVGRKGTIDRPALIDAVQPLWAIDTTFVVRPFGVNVRVLHAFLNYVDLAQLNEASGVPSISSDTLGSFQVPDALLQLPVAATDAIFTIDNDLAASIDRRSQLETGKRGLLQKLLIRK